MLREYLRMHDTYIMTVVYGIRTKKQFAKYKDIVSSESCLGPCIYVGSAKLTDRQMTQMIIDLPAEQTYYRGSYHKALIPTPSYTKFCEMIDRELPDAVVDIYSYAYSEWWKPSATEFQNPLLKVDISYSRQAPKYCIDMTYKAFCKYNKQQIGRGVRIKGFHKHSVLLEDIHTFEEFLLFFDELMTQVQAGAMFISNPSRLVECVTWRK